MSQAQIREHFIGLTHFIACSMLPEDARDEVSVDASWDSGQLKVNLNVPSEFRGMLIGRSGHMVRSLRQVLNCSNFEVPGGVELDIV